ncbi:MAG TPA: sulfatase/phosphatase domain-containing protein [Rhodanobacteraceae bacterium]
MTGESQMSRRDLLKAMGGVAGAAMLPLKAFAGPSRTRSEAPVGRGVGAARDRGDRRPNILWILAEGMPTAALSCYGSKLVQTPNIDRIAREGMLFHNAFCTNALCAPSRSTFISGKYSCHTGVNTNGSANGLQKPPHFLPGQETFPLLLRRQGYQTAQAGKWHVIGTNPGQQGFDAFLYKKGWGGPYYDPDGYLENSSPGSVTEKSVVRNGYMTDVFTEYTLDAMQRMAKSGKPFLMMFSPFNDHRPFTPPHRFENLYRGRHWPESNTFWDDYSHRATAAKMAHMRIGFMPDYHAPQTWPEPERQEWNYQQFMSHFMATLHALDEDVGKVLDYLDQSGLAENTIVMFSSDHGFFLGDHGWFDKRFMYEQAIRVPWVVRWPGRVKPGTSSDAWTINIDNAPTTVALAGLPVPAEMQGRSIVPLFDGTTPKDWHRDLYYHYYEFAPPHFVYPHYGIRTERYKLINYYRQNEWELFDLKMDPDEMYSQMEWGGYNVHKGYDGTATDLVARLKALRQTYRDDTGWPIKYWPTSAYD